MSTLETQTLQRALLRPFILHTLRAAGFHSTKPSVLDTLVNLTERYLILLAQNTATHARNTHSGPATLSDARMALTACGALTPVSSGAQQEWTEILRVPASRMGEEVENGGKAREGAEKRKRDEEDVVDVRGFVNWFEGADYAEIRRVAGAGTEGGGGIAGPTAAAGTAAPGVGNGEGGDGGNAPSVQATAAATVGVGGGVVQAEDFLTVLKKRLGKAGVEDARLVGTVLGRPADDRGVLVEGGPVQRLRDWKPPRKMVAVDKTGVGGEDFDSQTAMEMESIASSSTVGREDAREMEVV